MAVDFEARQATVIYRVGKGSVDAIIAALAKSKRYGATLAVPVFSFVEGTGVLVGGRTTTAALRPGSTGTVEVSLKLIGDGFTVQADEDRPGMRVVLGEVAGIGIETREATLEAVEGQGALMLDVTVEEALEAGEYSLPFELEYVPHVKGKAKKTQRVRSAVVLRIAG